MAHCIVEYSANLEADLSPRRLLERMHYIVADGDSGHAFVAVLIRMGQGRDEATRKRVSQELLAALADETRESFAKRGLSLSVEIQEIDEAGASRKNNLHERVGSKPRR